MITKCIIVDDEPIAIEIIKEHLSSFDNISIVAECKNAVEAFEILKKKKVDLMFLDIQMPKMTGLDMLKNISNPPKVVITTAYRDFAIEGYELDVVDYLLKPISFDRFIMAIDKYYNYYINKVIDIKTEESISPVSFIYIKDNNQTLKVYLNDILYIESYADHINIHLKTKIIDINYQIGVIEEELPQQFFMRTHKSYIVSVKHIESFTSKHLMMVNNIKIPIGITYKDSVLKKLNSSVI